MREKRASLAGPGQVRRRWRKYDGEAAANFDSWNATSCYIAHTVYKCVSFLRTETSQFRVLQMTDT